MKLHRGERDYYRVNITVEPALSGTWQASFDDGATWVDATVAGSDLVWLVAGPDYNAAAVSQDPGDTDATVAATVAPLLRIKDGPVLDIETGPVIEVGG